MPRSELRAALEGRGRLPVILDIRDDVDVLLGRESGGSIQANIEACRQVGSDLNYIIGESGLFMVFVPQPMEMLYLILQDSMVMHYLDWPDTYRAAMEEVEETSHFIIDCAADAGADMIMFGGAGTEIFSPDMIEQHIISPSAGYVKRCQERKLFSLMHCCGRTKILLDRGWLGQVRPTIFESFTPLPLGDIESPEAAAARLPAETFFKGGLSLDLLLNGTAEDADEAAEKAIKAFGGRRFILAGTCAILTGTPLENLRAAAAAAERMSSSSARMH